jgi:flavoprotein
MYILILAIAMVYLYIFSGVNLKRDDYSRSSMPPPSKLKLRQERCITCLRECEYEPINRMEMLTILGYCRDKCTIPCSE